MKLNITRSLGVLTACLIGGATIYASDMVGIYTVVEKVVMEPSDAAPQRVQIWGAFALAEPKNGSLYGPAQRGYVYYSCPSGQETVCRREWEDLKSVAGKNTGVGFGMRFSNNGRIRKADEKPAAPDVYPIERGIIRLSAGHDSMPVIDRLKAALKTQ